MADMMKRLADSEPPGGHVLTDAARTTLGGEMIEYGQNSSVVPVLCVHCGRPILGAETIWIGCLGYHPECTRSPFATEPCSNCVAQAARIAELEAHIAALEAK
jgi:hypothetical protein